jgi:hypothetical protein
VRWGRKGAKVRIARAALRKAAGVQVEQEPEQTFEDFAAACGITLTPAQAEFARVAYDGAPPTANMGAPNAELAQVWRGGAWDLLPEHARRVVVAVCGARSGKTLLGSLQVLRLACTVPLDTLAPGEIAVCPIVAPDLDTARQTLAFARGAAERLIPQAIHKSDADGFVIMREGGKRVKIAARAASVGGRSVRGRSMPAALLEELAFFRDSLTGRINDEEIWRAINPRIMPGGQLICLSTPYTELGLLHQLWRDNYGHPTNALCAHAPTLLMRGKDAAIAQLIADESKRDPMNSAREYGAEFLSAAAGTFFDAGAIARAIYASGPLVRDARKKAAAGADFAFTSDSSALVIAQREDTPDGPRYDVLEIVERVPKPREPLSPGATVREFADVCARQYVRGVMADAHYREAIREHLEASRLTLLGAPEGSGGKAESYAQFRTLLHDGRVRLPPHERLERQLREIVSQPTAGGALSISSPRYKSGGHGDLVSALVLAIWQLARGAGTIDTPEQWTIGWSSRGRLSGQEPSQIETRFHRAFR